MRLGLPFEKRKDDMGKGEIGEAARMRRGSLINGGGRQWEGKAGALSLH